MKIVSLQAENIKRLVAVEITPTGDVVQITGKNGQGKSSVLDSIWWALAGTSNIQEKPIRAGQESARIRLDLGDIVVTRTFKESKDGSYTTSIAVENADGSRFPSPQTMLDGLIGSLAFDPLAFSRMAPKEQFEVLRKFVPGVDFAAVAKANADDYAARTALNRKAKELRAQAAGVQVPSDAPVEPVDESALIDCLSKAADHNAAVDREESRRAAEDAKLASLRDRVAALKDELRRVTEEGKQLADSITNRGPVEDRIDVAAVRSDIEMAKSANAAYRRREDRKRIEAEADAAESKARELTDKMAARDGEVLDAVRRAELPVDGLSLSDGSVFFNGIPFDQASDAEKLRVSTAIAMAGSGKLRIARIRDGSLLDEDSLAIVCEMAKARDFQVWIERVDSSGKVGFVIEDGHVKGGAN